MIFLLEELYNLGKYHHMVKSDRATKFLTLINISSMVSTLENLDDDECTDKLRGGSFVVLR